MSLPQSKKLKFTYGHQFEPEKFSLYEITKLCAECELERGVLEDQILEKYFVKHSQASTSKFSATDNRKKLAMNCFLSVRAYQIVEDIRI
ncbi:MAG: hypothetical protein F6K35_31150 [Okeania sp. SIO2H7]|nr:hypothetical protein [Okeania sp. SIO2H7]